LTFFGLTYAITWCLLPFGTFGAYGPLVAAIVVLSLTRGRAGLRELGSRMVRWRVRWYWYALAIGLALSGFALGVALNVVLGASAPSLAPLNPWYAVVVVFAVRLVNPLDGPMGEEPGWRGFALPGLQAGRSPLSATLMLAFLVTVWHVPLLLPRYGLRPIELLATFAITFWYSWLFNRTGGSVLVTLITHAAQGIVQPSALWVAATPASRVIMLDCALWCAAAICLVILDRGTWRAAAPATTRPPRDVALQSPTARDYDSAPVRGKPLAQNNQVDPRTGAGWQ